jgi:hypothetical protein
MSPGGSGIPPILQPPVFDDKLAQLGSLDPNRRAAQAPSDYTQMIRGAPAPASRGPSPTQASAPVDRAAAPKGSADAPNTTRQKIPTPLLIILNAVVILVIIIVAWALFRRPPAVPTVAPPAVSAPAVSAPTIAPPAPPR